MPRLARRSPEGGFTFVELMAVLILASISVVYVVLRLDGLTADSRLSAAGRHIASTVEWIRGEAAAQARDLQIEFDLDNARYRIVIPPRPGLHRDARDQEEWDVLSWSLLPDGVRFVDIQFTASDSDRAKEDVSSKGVRTVTFTRSGSAPSFMVHLKSSEIRSRHFGQYSIEVNGFTGAVSSEVGYKDFGAVREAHEMQ